MTFGLNFSVCVRCSVRESQFVLQTKKQDFINLNKAGSAAFGQYID